MNVNYALLCDYALQSADGKVSLMGVFTRITAAQVPVMLPRAYFVFELGLDYTEVGKEFEIRVECVDSDGEPVLQTVNSILIQGTAKPGDKPTVPQILQLPPLTFSREGAHDFNIFVGSDPTPKNRASFSIVVSPPASATPDIIPPPASPAS